MRQQRLEILVGLGLFAVTAAVFGPACAADFTNYDDPGYASENTLVLGGLSAAGVRWAFTTFHTSNWHPLTWLSLQLDASLFGPGPFGFHLTNVLLHAANAALLFCALRLLTGALWRSALVAGLFALHPLRVESVAWVAERKDVLCGLFFMLTLLAYGWYARRPGWRRYLPVLLCFALGLLAKPMLVTLPCLLLLLDYWPLRRLDAGWRWPLLEKLPLFALSVGSCVATWLAQRQGRAVVTLTALPPGQRVGTALLGYWEYLGKTVWPVGLAPFYPHPYLLGETLPPARVAAAGLGLAAATLVCLWQRRARPYLLVGWLWYLGTLVPVIGLVQVGSQRVADRYTYLPLVGIFLLAVWGAADLAGRLRLPRWAPAAAAGVVLAACAACTEAQLAHWHDSLAVWRRIFEVSPPSALAHFGVGQALEGQGERAEAIHHYREALLLYPSFARAEKALGEALEKAGQQQEAVRHLQAAVRLDPGNVQARALLKSALEKLGPGQDPVRHYQDLVALDPNDPEAHTNLAVALENQGRPDEALRHYRWAVGLNPARAGGHYNLGAALARQGRLDRAVPEFREALRLDPSHGAASHELELALQGLRRD